MTKQSDLYVQAEVALKASIKESALVKTAQDKLNDRKKGVYDTMVAAAVSLGKKDFDKLIGDLQAKIATNEDGMAKALKCKLDKKGEKYTVPSAWSSAKSHLGNAFKHKVPMVEDGEARAFAAIRKDSMAAVKAAKLGERKDDEIVRDTVLEQLAKLGELVKDSDTTMLDNAALSAELESLTARFQAGMVGEVTETAKAA